MAGATRQGKEVDSKVGKDCVHKEMQYPVKRDVAAAVLDPFCLDRKSVV